ncbi:hypothetical protein BDF14DRAFT_1847324 [Spinellus fusiger]|nr:hypothetical protein BDF14DRAFT_1847324 [Spinellus fusiger]
MSSPSSVSSPIAVSHPPSPSPSPRTNKGSPPRKRKKDPIEPQKSTRHKVSRKPRAEKKEADNNDECDVCGGLGRFLCCDACPKVFHFTCVDPPMEEKEVEQLEGQWFCEECRSQHEEKQQPKKRKKTKKKTVERQNLFEGLLLGLKGKNPKTFKLPKDIRMFFRGVGANAMGDYIDATTVKSVRYRHGQREEPDYYQLKDKDGRFIICYRCRKTAVAAPMVGCDYCPLYWHMDCLDPPMCIPPNVTRNWMCPNHAEHAMPRRRTQRHPIIVESKYHSIYNHGDIEIISDDSTDSVHTLEDEENIDQLAACGGVIYRLSAKVIQVDFMEYAKR